MCAMRHKFISSFLSNNVCVLYFEKRIYFNFRFHIHLRGHMNRRVVVCRTLFLTTNYLNAAANIDAVHIKF
jgi:hypothetical protein